MTAPARGEVAEALVAFAQRLVATPSPSGEEGRVSELIAAELNRLGYREVEVDEHGNVQGRLGEGPARLMSNGHIDHVPVGEMKAPFEAQLLPGEEFGEPGTVLRGRGSCDMKANVAAALYAAAFLDPATELRRGSYLFTADVQEETDSPLGVRAMLARGVRAEYGLSVESTELEVSLGHRGKAQLDVIVPGRSSHASTPEAGLNAIYRALPFLAALRDVSGLPSDPLFGAATLTVIGIASEPAEEVAVVPSACTIRVDRRYVPGESAESCLHELERLVAEVGRREGIEARVELIDDYPLMSIPPDHPLVEHGREAVRSVRDETPPLRTWRFGVNATFMSAAGIPSIGIGPGSEDWAHTDEEHVPVEQLVEASRIYAALIERVCA